MLGCAGVAQAQAFEVASVKPSPPPAPARGASRVVRGGPGSSDPGLATFENCDLFSLVTMAYGVQHYQVAGPDWLSTTRFDIAARLPEGATREQYRLMLQDLLIKRFGLELHREKREMATYELTVGPNGSKLKESADQSPAADEDGSVQPAPTPARPPMGFSGAARLSIPKISMERLVALLGGQLGQPVTDATGLKAMYQVNLHYTVGLATNISETASTEPPLIDAVREQLGLKLTPRKGLVDILAIDHVEKVPSGN
jgi:uncharacterized protein (TIGR03435 family)